MCVLVDPFTQANNILILGDLEDYEYVSDEDAFKENIPPSGTPVKVSSM